MEQNSYRFTITLICHTPQTGEKYLGFMPSAIMIASYSGLFGALAVTGIGICFTRKVWVLACGAILSGAALGVLMYVLWGWFTHGFELFQVCVLAPAALMLLLVMAAQNWFVFYENRADVLQSSRPALVLIGGALASILVDHVAIGPYGSLLLLLIRASTGSLAILWCIEPIHRSIERTRSALLGTSIGICKVLLPLTGIVVFVRTIAAANAAPVSVDKESQSRWNQSRLANLIGIFWDLGRLALVILVNGARVPPRARAFDPLEALWQQKDGQSITGEMPRVKRDSVVIIFVLALHVLCGVLIVKG